MPKIKVEIEVPDDKYCENEDTTCPMCLEGNWGMCYCAIFDDNLEIDSDSGCCIRCDKCKQAEVESLNVIIGELVKEIRAQ